MSKALAVAFGLLVWSNSAVAFSIDGVTVLPIAPITPENEVALEILITTPSAPASLFQPTEVTVAANEIFVDVFTNAGPLTVLDSLIESVGLGMLQPGTYEYTVVLNPAFEVGWGTRTVTGSFSVVDACSLPADTGPCDGVCPRFFFNTSSGQCEPFVYGCCEGNANNFLTLEECESACVVGVAGDIPTVSEWGSVVMALLVLTAGTLVFMRRRGATEAI